VNGGPGLDLGRPRDLGALLSDSLRVYRDHFGAFITLSAAVVVPVQLVVSGIGLEELTSPWKENPGAAELAVPTAVSFFVTAPLITATSIHALHSVAAGQRPKAGQALQAGLDAFTPVFMAILLVAMGVALGLLALLLPGLYLVVRWFFVPQAVVIEGRRSVGALARSGELVSGQWWRILGLVLVANLVALIPGTLILSPLDAAAESADRQVISLIGGMVSSSLTAPFVALFSTLVYYDLRARGRPSAPPL
jgi:hypothetical protein